MWPTPANSASETVDADQDVLATGIAPLEVDDPMEAVRPQSEEALLDHRHGFSFMLADSHPLLNLKPVLHREDEQEDQRGAHRDLHQSLHERHAGGGCAAAPLCHCRGKDRLSHRPVSDVHIWQRPVSYGEPVTSA